MKRDPDRICNWDGKSFVVRGWIDIVVKDDSLRLL